MKVSLLVCFSGFTAVVHTLGCAADPPGGSAAPGKGEALSRPREDGWEFFPGPFAVGSRVVGSTEYSVILSALPLRTTEAGLAELPLGSMAFQWPRTHDLAVQIEELESEEIPLAQPLLPSRGVLYRNQHPGETPYAYTAQGRADRFYPEQVARFSDPYVLRDVRAATLWIHPFQYNGARKILRVVRRLRFRVVEDPSGVASDPLPAYRGAILPQMDAMYRGLFVNYQRSFALALGELGDLLVIHTARDAQAIQPYLTWKRQKGFEVSAEVVAAGTSIKQVVQQAAQANPELLYVQIVGDWADIKSDLVSGGPADPALGCVRGTDAVPDLIVGRFSGRSAAEISVQIDKAIGYEKQPEKEGTWYQRALGIGSSEGPGDDSELDYAHIDVIKENKLLRSTYGEVVEAYQTPAKSVVVNAINQGVSLINYAGHGDVGELVTGGLTTADVRALTNGARLPVLLAVACMTGQFNASTDCLGESLLKKSGGGAVAAVMSSITQPWDPPMRGQDYMNDLLTGGYDYAANPGDGKSTSEGRTTVGSLVFNALALMLTESAGSEDLETARTWTLFGDATLQIRTAKPRPIALSSQSPMAGVPFQTQVTSSGQPLAGALVALSSADEMISGVTDAQGMVTLAHQLKPGKATLVVTGFNLDTIALETTIRIPIVVEQVELRGTLVDDQDPSFLWINQQPAALTPQGTWQASLPWSADLQALPVNLRWCDSSGNQGDTAFTLSLEDQ